MDPYYQDDLVTLYHGDCMELTAWLEADVLVTDPPYGRGWKQGAKDARPGRGASSSHVGIAGDHSTEARDGVLRLWGDRPAIVFGDLMLAPPGRTKQVLVYGKAVNAGAYGATAGRRRDLEGIYLIGPWSSGIGGASSLISTNASVGDPKNKTGHPHTKPTDVMLEVVAIATHGAVADPFAGSGSTLFAAKYLGRQAIGVELDERYCEIAARRLAQDTLFGDTA